MRTYSSYYTPETGFWLNKLTSGLTLSPEEYKGIFYQLGKGLSHVVNSLPVASGPTMVACSSEDADWLAKGLLDGLINQNTGLAVFWTERYRHPDNPLLEVTPIIKSYVEDMESCQNLIVIKSIIRNSCVVKTQLLRLIEGASPENIIIIAPVMLHGAEQKLRNEFPISIGRKFRFITLAIDDEINAEGQVVPGIGGSIYAELGLGDVHTKNKYIPEIVRQRREA